MPTILDCFTLRQHTDQYSGPHYAMCPYSILRYATALPQSGPKRVTSVAGKVTVPKGILEGEKFFSSVEIFTFGNVSFIQIS